MSVTTNVEVPDSLYSLSDEEVGFIFKESAKTVLSKDTIVSLVERRYPNQRRVAKSIANRVNEADLNFIHDEIVSAVGEVKEAKVLPFHRDRTRVTLICD